MSQYEVVSVIRDLGGRAHFAEIVREVSRRRGVESQGQTGLGLRGAMRKGWVSRPSLGVYELREGAP